MKKKNVWKIEYQYLENFEHRIEKMLSFLNTNNIKSIMDLGCGLQTLKRKLKDDVEYIGIDQYNHVETSIIVDLNNGEFYNKKVDIVFCSGILEYIYDVESLIKNISNNTDIVIFSYNFIENVKNRGEWVNAYNKKELLTIFNKCGYVNIILLSDFKYFRNSLYSNHDTVGIVSKSSFDTNIINFNTVNGMKMSEYFIKIVDSLAWFIPFKKKREEFKSKFYDIG